MIGQQDMSDEVRRTGELPVREHLRPRRRQLPDENVWVWTRNEWGDLCFDIVPMARADELEVEGEA